MFELLSQDIENILNKLNEEQLHELNHRVVTKLNLFHKAKRLQALAKFNVRDRAYFIDNGHKISGTITRLNQKSVSFLDDHGSRWTVAPGLLTKLI